MVLLDQWDDIIYINVCVRFLISTRNNFKKKKLRQIFFKKLKNLFLFYFLKLRNTFFFMYLFYSVLWFLFDADMTFFIAIIFFIYYFMSYMCASEHSINHVNNFHYWDDDTIQDEMLSKSSRNNKYSQNIGPKRCFAY